MIKLLLASLLLHENLILNDHIVNDSDHCSYMIVLPANIEDEHDVWDWRNDKTTREMSVNTEAVTWEAHRAWYQATLTNISRFLYIGYINGEAKAGMCRFDIDNIENVAEVSIVINPIYRGKSLSRLLLLGALDVFPYINKLTLIAIIRRENIASIKCFERCGFILKEQGDLSRYIRSLTAEM